jgi:hypothetical protein
MQRQLPGTLGEQLPRRPVDTHDYYYDSEAFAHPNAEFSDPGPAALS